MNTEWGPLIWVRWEIRYSFNCLASKGIFFSIWMSSRNGDNGRGLLDRLLVHLCVNPQVCLDPLEMNLLTASDSSEIYLFLAGVCVLSNKYPLGSFWIGYLFRMSACLNLGGSKWIVMHWLTPWFVLDWDEDRLGVEASELCWAVAPWESGLRRQWTKILLRISPEKKITSWSRVVPPSFVFDGCSAWIVVGVL